MLKPILLKAADKNNHSLNVREFKENVKFKFWMILSKERFGYPNSKKAV